MSNQRSVMTEFRFLDQKRQAEGLTAGEAARYAQLRDLVGPETAGSPRSGFDVNAAAARLRESLLPAGLRARPAEAAPPPEPAPVVPAPEALALEEAWAEAPFAALEPAPAEPLFDPGSLAQEVRPQAWNPEAPGYDPDAPYDEAAWIAAGYDPNATYDWSALGYGPDGQPLATEAAPADFPVEAAADGSVEVAAPPAEAAPGPPPGSVDAPFELEPAGADAGWGTPDATPAGPVASDGPVQPWDAAFAEQVAEAPAQPAAAVLEEAAPLVPAPEEEPLPFDPNAPFDHAKWFGHAATPVPAPEPAPAPAFGEYDDAALLAAPGAPDLLQLAEPAPELASAESAHGGADPSAAWDGDATPLAYEPAPPGAPFGAYDESVAPSADGALAALLPFDPAAASAIEAGALPEGYEPGGPALDPAALPGADSFGSQDAAFSPDQQYGGPEGDTLPGGAPLELGDEMPDWQPEAALEQGFELASDGSFGHVEAPSARTPAWGTAVPPSPREGWESAPALDLGGPFEAPGAAPVQAPEAAPAAEELPTIDGAELLEELPPEELPAGAGSPLDGAFDDAAAVETAAYPPPDLGPDLQAAPVSAGLPAEAAPLEPLEPEPAVSYQAPFADVPPEIAAAYGRAEPASGDAGSGAIGAAVAMDAFELPPAVAGGLYEPTPEAVSLEAVSLEAVPPEAEPPAPPPGVEIPGTHRVVLHTVDGQVKRGLLVDARLDAPSLPLRPQGPGAPEEIATDAIKAIFFMLTPGEKAPAPEGRKVRVTFRDGRQVAGFSPDYQEGLVGFFMIPADTRTNTGRIWVYQAAVKAVAVS